MTPDGNEPTNWRAALHQVFTPSAPIDGKEFFAGRARQLQTIFDAVNQRGQHVIIFGERGVGKTSLVNVLAGYVQAAGAQVLAPHVNCDGTDDFTSLWRKVLSRIHLTVHERSMGLVPMVSASVQTLAENLPPQLTPDLVASIVRGVGSQAVLMIILDEFDRLPERASSRLMADTIKTLSDQAVPATLIVVGVAHTVQDLIGEHRSVERCLVQVPLPRMTRDELREIVLNRLPLLGLTMQPAALEHLVTLSRGLPHYTHMLGLYAARRALEKEAKEITAADLNEAVKEAIANTNQSILGLYHQATVSTRKDNLYTQVVLACALADEDDLGYFAPKDVRDPLNRIMVDKMYDVTAFSKYLHELCEADRGPLLEKTGPKHRTRFRFTNPLLQPFIVMRGLVSGLISQREAEEKG